MKDRSSTFKPDGIPKNVRCYDNGGATADRYTVVFTGRYRHLTGGVFVHLAMSGSPFHPQGVGQHGENGTQIDAPQGWAPAIGRKCHLGTRIPFKELPDDCKRLVLRDYDELWGL